MAEETIEIRYLVKAVDEATKTIDKINKNLGNLRGSVENSKKAVQELGESAGGIGKLIVKVGLLSAAFVALSTSSKAVSVLTYGIDFFNKNMAKAANLSATFGKNFPIMSRLVNRAFVKMVDVGQVFRIVLTDTNKAMVSTLAVFKQTFTASKSIGGAFIEAATKTELFSKGIFGLATRAAGLATVFTLLGTNMLRSESIMFKITGGALLALTIALGGLAVIIRQTLIWIGQFVYAIGTSLVNAMQHSVDEMTHLQETTFAFQFVVEELDKTTGGAIGTFEEWNETIKDFSNTMGFAVDETQKSVSELLRFGHSIGLNRKEMEKLLPIIGNLAKVNHRDLFTSTLAVVEALNGQTQMLQNMGVNLTEHALLESEFVEGHKKSLTALSNEQKIMARYNLLLNKTNLLTGFAAKQANTIVGQMQRQEVAQKNLNQSLGVGANLIEQKVITAWTSFLEILNKLPTPITNTIGFTTALTGRALQAIGIFLQWSFAIVLVSTSIKALNIILRNNYIQKFTAQLANSVLVTQKLASVSQLASTVIQKSLLKISTTGLSVTSVFKLLTVGMFTFGKAALVALAPFLGFAAVIGVVVAAFYVLYEALKRIDNQTKVFTNSWSKLVQWWEQSSIIQTTIAAISNATTFLADFFLRVFINAIYNVAIAIVAMVAAFYQLKSAFIDIWAGARDLFNGLIESIKKMLGKALKLFASLSEKVVSILGINTAYAASIKKASDEFEKSSIKNKGLTDEEIKARKKAKDEVDKYKNLIFKLNDARNDELLAIGRVSNREDEAHRQRMSNARDYVAELKKIREAEDARIQQAQAQLQLMIGEIGGTVGLGQRQSEALVDAIKSGDVKKAIVDVLNKSGNVWLQIVGLVVDVFGKSRQTFKNIIAGIEEVLENILGNLAENIPYTIQKIFRDILPKLFESAYPALEAFVTTFFDVLSDESMWDRWFDAIATFVSDPEKIRNISEALIRSIAKGLPKFAYLVVKGVVELIIKIIVNVLRGIVDIFTRIFGICKSIGGVFESIYAGIQKVFEFVSKTISKITGGAAGGGGAADVVKTVATGGLNKVFGFSQGGIPELINGIRAQSGGIIAGNQTTGDNIPARVNSREMILTLEDQAKLMRMIREGGDGEKTTIVRHETVVKVGENELGRTIDDLKLNGWLRA